MKEENKLYFDLLDQVNQYSKAYIDGIDKLPAFPGEGRLNDLDVFSEGLPQRSVAPSLVLSLLHGVGSKATTASTGGRYFGFVSGGLLPVAHGAEWLADTWNQNCGLYLMSPIASKLEEICEQWMVELLGLEKGTAAGMVTGTSNALICAFAAARYHLLQKQGYDLEKKGIRNAPALRVVITASAHSSVKAALSLLGFGLEEIELGPVDEYGRVIIEQLPPLDSRTLLVIQAGNVNGGSFDPIDELCDLAVKSGAWVHIDGAFGLWAAASRKQRHLVRGLEKADSYSVDAHKTLNAAYDCGIVLCRHRSALVKALQASGPYLQYSENRDGMLYTTEMSRRARSIVLWAVLKQLGAHGVEELIDRLCAHTLYFAEGLKAEGFTIVNPVFFNQFMVMCNSEEETKSVLEKIQKGGICWCGSSVWNNEFVIRVSVCSHKTTRKDIDLSVKAFKDALGV